MRRLQREGRGGVGLSRLWLAAFAALALPLCGGEAPAGGERAPAVAGSFYPAEPEKLGAALRLLLRDAAEPRVGRPVALVLPHAGWVFSGAIAADGFRQAAPHTYRVVVLLGTNHTTAGFDRIALSPARGFRTPLGVAEIDRELQRELLSACPDCVTDEAVHAREHSIEVLLPFVQQLFPRARILPAVVGTPDLGLCQRFGAALGKLLQGRDGLIVASSDLSHYPAAADAERTDRRTLEAIASMSPARVRSTLRSALASGIRNLDTGACGEAPILAALVAARALGATRAVVVSYAHSGRSPVGEQARVVGYGAVALLGDTQARPSQDGASDAPAGEVAATAERRLLLFARETIRSFLATGLAPPPRGLAGFDGRRGVFVTLRKSGQLRGCIGRVVPDKLVPELVGEMALRSAFDDPRFPPLGAAELPAVEIEISLLTPPRRVGSAAEVVAGRDGVVLEKAGQSAVFLPQVAREQGWSRQELLDNLCLKAGLARGCWAQGASLSTFQARVLREGG